LLEPERVAGVITTAAVVTMEVDRNAAVVAFDARLRSGDPLAPTGEGAVKVTMPGHGSRSSVRFV
jgi:hypothetical protein